MTGGWAMTRRMNDVLHSVGEQALIRRLTARLRPGRDVVAGPGDDCAVVRAGDEDWLLTSDPVIGGVHVSAEQVQLVQGMARALGASDEKPQVSRFDWPMHNNQQLDLGEGAASAALAGFIGRKLEQQACHGVVLLGEQCRQRVPLDQLGAAIVVSTVSTAEMLVDSRRKREAWRDLQPLRGQA